MAGLLRRAAGQNLTDGWCGWFARRYLAAGWTVTDLAETLARVPSREDWPRAVRVLPPQRALRFWLRRTPASHWADDWLAMSPGPSRVRARQARALRAAQQTERAARAAAAARAADGPPAEARAIFERMGWRAGPPPPESGRAGRRPSLRRGADNADAAAG